MPPCPGKVGHCTTKLRLKTCVFHALGNSKGSANARMWQSQLQSSYVLSFTAVPGSAGEARADQRRTPALFLLPCPLWSELSLCSIYETNINKMVGRTNSIIGEGLFWEPSPCS